MLAWISNLVWLGLLLLLLANLPSFAWFLWQLWRRPHTIPNEQLPKAAVVLCLRGADPTLERCIEGLLTQDYPRFEVVIIVDHSSDPAWKLAQDIVQRYPNVALRLELLEHPANSCSLKCSSLVQAISGLNDSPEVLAFLDADTTPYRGWIRDLVSPLGQAGAGATTGARWFMPERPTWGSVVRYQWGMAAVLTCNALGIAWGGTLAIRRDAFIRAGLREKWGAAYCEDTMIPAAIRPLGLRLQYLPHMIMVNRESCSLPGFFEWCTRQMLAIRLYDRRAWRPIFAHALFSIMGWIAPPIVAIAAAVSQEWKSVVRLALSFAAFWVTQWLAMLIIEKSVQRVVVARSQKADWLRWAALWRTLVCIPFTQMIYFAALLAALRIRRVCWRSIWYEIAGPFQVRMMSYHPFEQRPPDSDRQPA